MYDNNDNNYENGYTPDENRSETPSPENRPPQQTPYGGYYQGGQYSNNRDQNGGYNWQLNDYSEQNSNKPKKPRNKKGLKIFAGVVCSIVFVASIGFGIAGLSALVTNRPDIENTNSNVTEVNNTPNLVINNRPTDSSGIIDDGSALSGERVYEKVSPSIVGVIVYSSEFNTTASGSGSGIILSTDGYIVTNEHVVDGAKLIEVVLNNNERYTAKLVGYDTQTDLAVIKIEATNLVPAELGNSEELKPGETVYAIGNPGGMEFANSITSGIISGVDRLITSSSTGYVMNCIQTNAAINPGNSGGALVDRYGRVVGISAAKLSSVSYEGMGFAIPISDSIDLIEDLINYGYIKGRPKLGITYSTISSAAANFYGVPAGLRVQSIDPESDAYAKGLKTGDIITAINGKKTESSSDVMAIMGECKAGDTITISVYRSGKTGEMKVVLSENDGRDTSNYVSTDSSSGNNNQSGNNNGNGYYNPFEFFPFN